MRPGPPAHAPSAGPILTSPLLQRTGAPHGFSTRAGGVSSAPFDALNFGNPGDLPPGISRDPKANIEANFAIALAAAGAPGRRIIQVHQVHAADVLIHRAGDGGPAVVWGDVRADAIVTDDPACIVAVRVADCCPILLASASGRVVGAVHAGWRGVVAGVAPRAVERARELAGGAPILAAVGPCISAAAFEVGDEVAAEFDRALPGAPGVVLRGPGKPRLDLPGAIAEQLRAAGVAEIERSDQCTVGRPDLFFSHRRDRGVTGRMIGFIGPA